MKASRPSLAVALAGGGWAAHDGLGDDDRRRRGRHPRSSPRAGSAGCTGEALAGSGGFRRRSTSRRTSTSWPELPWRWYAAGPKAILDVPATLEYLETRGCARHRRRHRRDARASGSTGSGISCTGPRSRTWPRLRAGSRPRKPRPRLRHSPVRAGPAGGCLPPRRRPPGRGAGHGRGREGADRGARPDALAAGPDPPS